MTLSLQDSGELTEVQLMQGEFTTQERLDLHENGWRESFEKLKAPKLSLPETRLASLG